MSADAQGVPDQPGNANAARQAELEEFVAALQDHLEEAARRARQRLACRASVLLADFEEEARFALEDMAWQVVEEFERFVGLAEQTTQPRIEGQS